MSSYSKSVLSAEDDFNYAKPRLLSREELQQVSFKRAGFGQTAQNSYNCRISSGPVNSFHRAYGLASRIDNSVHKAYGLGGYASDSGNSLDRWRWNAGGGTYGDPSAISYIKEEEGDRAAAESLFAMKPDPLRKLNKLLVGGFGDDSEEDGSDEEVDIEEQPEKEVAEEEKFDHSKDDSDAEKAKSGIAQSMQAALTNATGEPISGREGEEDDKDKDNDEQSDFVQRPMGLPLEYIAQLGMLRGAFELPHVRRLAVINNNNKEWTIWDSEECIKPFAESQTCLPLDSLASYTRKRMDEILESMLRIQRRAANFVGQYHDHLALGRFDITWMARSALKGLSEVGKQEAVLKRNGPRILKPEVMRFLQELAALDVFANELQGYDVAANDADDEDDRDGYAEGNDDYPMSSKHGSKIAGSEGDSQLDWDPALHAHTCNVCGLTEPVRHYTCCQRSQHRDNTYDICISCHDTGHTHCSDITHPPPTWRARCEHGFGTAREVSPAEARVMQLWVRTLERYRNNLEPNEGWTISNDDLCLAKFIRSQIETGQSSSEPDLCLTLERKFEHMLHIQREAVALISKTYANSDLYGFEQEAYGRAAHRLLLRILALESDPPKQGQCIVKDMTRHSLMSLATYDEDAGLYWSRLLGTKWYVDNDVEIYPEEFVKEEPNEEEEEGAEEDEGGWAAEGPVQRAPRMR